jgi:hypothetical protein
MMKRLLLCIVLLTSGICIAQSLSQGTVTQTNSAESEIDLFGDQAIAQLPPPSFKKTPPSALMVWLRSMGISMLCGYIACKNWVVRNYTRLFYVKPRLP